MMIRFVISILILSPTLSYAQNFVLKEELLKTKMYLEDHQVFTFEDTTGLLSFDKVSQPAFEGSFIPGKRESIHDGVSTLWMKFSITNTTETPRKLLLFLNDWDVSVWTDVSGSRTFLGRYGILAKNTGTEIYIGEDWNSCVLSEVPAQDTVTYFVKTPGFLRNDSFFIAIQDQGTITKQAQRDLWAIGTFSGCFIFIFVATFFLFIKSLKWRSVFYAINGICCFFFFTGYYGIEFFLPIEWPISYTFFLPLSSLSYFLFVYHFLELRRLKLQGTLFYSYIVLLSGAILLLLYFYLTGSENYYHFLGQVNRANILFTIFSLIAIVCVRGRRKYFIFGGVFFLFLGGMIFWYLRIVDPEHLSFIYPMAGYMLEMMTFLLGNFYILSMERTRSMRLLHEKEKELVRNNEQLVRFASVIKEKNKLIEGFKERLNHLTKKDQKETVVSDTSYHCVLDHLMQSTILTSDEWIEFKILFTQVYPGFLGGVRSKYPGLTETEERFLALTKLNLTNKEVASMLGISTDSVYKSRYRLSKKLNVPSDEIDGIVSKL
ncbi:hypothetical protein FNH22_05735 [Fulvivirga sp. M361]|uniref:7TM-DISM domain-containing protein n=1 Tax=Fulvivirga sp. M361 TaxID=2594266 RepID=UPI001179B2DD|nr:7TM-DISM domain-containing protein [Fulvivirga sp. M361]TRX60550.1 hypothetical protein FNH22_05735 [Fulvivirga sp. M361]